MRTFPLNRPERRFRKPSPVRVDPNNPQGVGVCDGCGAVVAFPDLRELYQYGGTPRGGPNTPMCGPGGGPGGPIVPTGLKMCPSCQDVPNGQFQPQTLGPDPIPLVGARPEQPTDFYLLTENQNVLTTEDGDEIMWG